MANRPDTKLRLLYTLRILQDRTDDERAISTPEIIETLHANYGIETARKSVNRDLKVLRKAGFDIEVRRKPFVAYALKTRVLDPPELNLVARAVKSSPFIAEEKAAALIDKLTLLASDEQREAIRSQAKAELYGEAKRRALAQHPTPPETAALAVSMFSDLRSGQVIDCLDLGAGAGALSKALYARYGKSVGRIDAVEADSELAVAYDAEMRAIGAPHVLTLGDALLYTPDRSYSRILLNPPYAKLAADDPRQSALPARSPNLYSAFLAVALDRLEEDGECVAIIPRSWTNGDYFTPFRKWALSSFSLDAIHVYGSRTDVFEEDGVLQETMIVRFSKRPQADVIRVTQSTGKADRVVAEEHLAEQLIIGSDKVIRIAPPDGTAAETIESRGWCPSTGKVVDHRNADRIYMTYDEALASTDNPRNIYRLVYAGNFRTGELSHPADIGKRQWFRADDGQSKAQLIQPGDYVLVRRVSSKEEPRRVVAYPFEASESIALENHMNFIHAGTSREIEPLPSPELARGLALWLNTTYIDSWFRNVSGSTQVNAKDIKAMPCPPDGDLVKLGERWEQNMSQDKIDVAAEEIGASLR